MSAGTTIRIDDDVPGFVQATESSKKSARDISNTVKGILFLHSQDNYDQ